MEYYDEFLDGLDARVIHDTHATVTGTDDRSLTVVSRGLEMMTFAPEVELILFSSIGPPDVDRDREYAATQADTEFEDVACNLLVERLQAGFTFL